jgi:hypothetical protein
MSYIGSTPTTQSFISGTDTFSGTGSQTNFTLSRLVNTVNDIQVVVNNVVQYPPNYSVSGTTLTISPAPSAGTNNVYARYLSTTLQTFAPSDLTVSTSTIQTSAVTTAKIADANITAAKMSGAQSGSTPIYAARAWVNFNGTTAGTFAGGASTVSRTAGSTTATITTTNDHGFITGNFVYALTGVVAGAYAVTVTGLKTFTITTVATTVLTAASITFAVVSIRASGNVSSVMDNGLGDFTVNFATAMPDVNYSVNVNSSLAGTTRGTSPSLFYSAANVEQVPTTGAFRVSFADTNFVDYDPKYVCVSVFR